jgi:hypothetical protein
MPIPQPNINDRVALYIGQTVIRALSAEAERDALREDLAQLKAEQNHIPEDAQVREAAV